MGPIGTSLLTLGALSTHVTCRLVRTAAGNLGRPKTQQLPSPGRPGKPPSHPRAPAQNEVPLPDTCTEAQQPQWEAVHCGRAIPPTWHT